jgi:hypothetical protein
MALVLGLNGILPGARVVWMLEAIDTEDRFKFVNWEMVSKDSAFSQLLEILPKPRWVIQNPHG